MEKMGTAEPNFEQLFEEKKRVRNPLVPVGALMTAGVLTAGLISFRRGNSQLGQVLMRARVVVTVALMDPRMVRYLTAWGSRLNVAASIAESLAYMHEQLQEGQDRSFLSQSDSFKTDAPGRNVAYCTFKLDVYGFGVVLLELLTGKLVQNNGFDLASWVHSVVREEWTAEVSDRALISEGAGEERMVNLLQVALKCINPSPDERPSTNRISAMSSEEIALYDHMCSYIWLCLVLLHISEIFRLKNGWKTFRLAKIDGNFPVISRRSYQKPSLKGNDFCRSRSHTDYCGQSDSEWRWTDQSLHFCFFDCGTLVFLLAFHYMHQNFDEVDNRRSKEESPYPK
ncbi:hypothetical protein NC651_028719 [Populus alba x Populus x berolinensis]|nr:hypothetical protein NC651_028719 [Populus alba x Populus x berolinensis]